MPLVLNFTVLAFLRILRSISNALISDFRNWCLGFLKTLHYWIPSLERVQPSCPVKWNSLPMSLWLLYILIPLFTLLVKFLCVLSSLQPPGGLIPFRRAGFSTYVI